MNDPLPHETDGNRQDAVADWRRLTAPFGSESVVWLVAELGDDQRARLRPQLSARAVRVRLDEVVGPLGWSNLYQPFGEAVICTLSLGGVSKSAVSAAPRLGPEARAEAALVLAAESFGMRPPADQEAHYWVDADPESGEPLYEPSLASAGTPPSQTTEEAPPTQDPAGPPPGAKTEGQKAIDRLVERLKGEGKGAEVARLVVAFAGYGGNPEQSRELYRRLRALLKSESPS